MFSASNNRISRLPGTTVFGLRLVDELNGLVLERTREIGQKRMRMFWHPIRFVVAFFHFDVLLHRDRSDPGGKVGVCLEVFRRAI
ncbi:MAG: hypothetical protein BZY81_08655 [SAR202 cluster bacterium Io17-Chloro-G4]|nr:MAG: hypothetical protein BZY81_08655 [SAR202 cluster bacterium Io17-Chloro-G4]